MNDGPNIPLTKTELLAGGREKMDHCFVSDLDTLGPPGRP